MNVCTQMFTTMLDLSSHDMKTIQECNDRWIGKEVLVWSCTYSTAVLIVGRMVPWHIADLNLILSTHMILWITRNGPWESPNTIRYFHKTNKQNIVAIIHTIEYCATLIRYKILSFAATWMEIWHYLKLNKSVIYTETKQWIRL